VTGELGSDSGIIEREVLVELITREVIQTGAVG
jgi:hypothetical protein